MLMVESLKAGLASGSGGAFSISLMTAFYAWVSKGQVRSGRGIHSASTGEYPL